MKVSWKQSSASLGPAAASRKRCTSSRCSSRTRWNGGSLTEVERRAPRRREASGVVVVEARSGGEAQAARPHVLAQERRRPVALLPILVGQRVEHREDVVEADRV